MTGGRTGITFAAGAVQPYLRRAVTDPEFRAQIRAAVAIGRDLYAGLRAGDARGAASRAASDADLHALARAVVSAFDGSGARAAAPRAARGRTALLGAAAVAVLLVNPVTGPPLRRALARVLAR